MLMPTRPGKPRASMSTVRRRGPVIAGWPVLVSPIGSGAVSQGASRRTGSGPEPRFSPAAAHPLAVWRKAGVPAPEKQCALYGLTPMRWRVSLKVGEHPGWASRILVSFYRRELIDRTQANS